MEKKCKNCAWFCHADGNCYGTKARLYAVVPASKAYGISCSDWSFDGLSDQERDAYGMTLMTMEEVI